MGHKCLSYRAMYLLGRNQNIIHAEEVINPETCIVGYTTKEHLILDLDKTHSLYATERLVRIIQQEFFDVGDCLISQSSYDGFHCIFDNKMSWKRILHIASTLQGLQIVNRNFVKVRRFREDLTLRISSIDRGREKSEAPKPMKVILQNPFPFPAYYSLEWYSHQKFSGIFEYLTCLSVFRAIEPIPIS